MSAVLEMLETGKGNSIIHRIDPRMKLGWFLCFIVVPILVTNPWILAALTVWVFLLAALAGVGGKMGRLMLVTYPVMVGFIMLTWPFFYGGGTRELVHFFFLRVTLEGIIYAFAMGLRIVLAVTVCTFFVMTTDIMDLASAVGESAQRLGISFTYPLMIISSFKFLPELSGDFLTIRESFLSRGAILQGRGVLHWIRSVVPLFIPLIDCSLRRAQHIATTLQLRAFGLPTPRTFYVQHRAGWPDVLFLAGGLAILALGVYGRFAGFSLLKL